MPERKTKYTDADLVERKPMTMTVLPQRPMPGPRTYKPSRDAELLDQALAEGHDIDSILAAANRTVQRTAPLARSIGQMREGSAAREEARLREQSTLGGQIAADPWGTARRAVMGAALPLSFAGGPVGAAASVPLAIEALGEFAESPSLLGAGMAALTVLPGVRAVKDAKAARLLKGDPFPRATAGAKWAQSRDIPYRAGSGVSGDATTRVAGQHTMPKGPIANQSVSDMMHPSSPMDRMFAEANPVYRQMRAQGQFNRFGEPTVDELAAGVGIRPSMSMLDVIEDNPIEQIAPSAEEAVDVVRQLRPRAQTVPVRRVPMGVLGDEFADIRGGGGAFDPRWRLMPEEAPYEDEFWELIARGR